MGLIGVGWCVGENKEADTQIRLSGCVGTVTMARGCLVAGLSMNSGTGGGDEHFEREPF